MSCMEEATETPLLEAFQTLCKSTRGPGAPSPASVTPPAVPVPQRQQLQIFGLGRAMLNNTKENIPYFHPALHFHLCCALDAAFASLQRGEGKEDRGGQAHGDFGVVAAGKEVGGKLGREQRSRQERMPGNRKWELGEEKSKAASPEMGTQHQGLVQHRDPKPSPKSLGAQHQQGDGGVMLHQHPLLGPCCRFLRAPASYRGEDEEGGRRRGCEPGSCAGWGRIPPFPPEDCGEQQRCSFCSLNRQSSRKEKQRVGFFIFFSLLLAFSFFLSFFFPSYASPVTPMGWQHPAPPPSARRDLTILPFSSFPHPELQDAPACPTSSCLPLTRCWGGRNPPALGCFCPAAQPS